MVRFIRLLLNEKRPFFMVRTPDNWEAESRKSPEYQGKTAQKLAQYGLKAARRAPQFSKRWSDANLQLKSSKTPENQHFPGFSYTLFVRLLLKPFAVFDRMWPRLTHFIRAKNGLTGTNGWVNGWVNGLTEGSTQGEFAGFFHERP